MSTTMVDIVTLASNILKAILSSSEQEYDSVCVMHGDGDSAVYRTSLFLLGPDTAWAASCIQYAACKLEYLIRHPDALTSFEGADHDNGLYGGGIRVNGNFMIVSGLTEEADLVMGLHILQSQQKIDVETARRIVGDVSNSCRELYDRVNARLVIMSLH